MNDYMLDENIMSKEEMAKTAYVRYTIKNEIGEGSYRIGFEKGFRQGFQIGIEQGANQKVLEIISTGIENNIPVEIISVMTKLSIEEVQKIIKNDQLKQQDER